MPEPVTGRDVCPECNGKRVVQMTNTKSCEKHLVKGWVPMWDGSSGIPYIWCQVCGGEGTASASLARVLMKQ